MWCACVLQAGIPNSRSIQIRWNIFFMKQCNEWKCLSQTAEAKGILTRYWRLALIPSLFKVCHTNETCSQAHCLLRVRQTRPTWWDVLDYPNSHWQILCSRRYRLLRHSKERQRLDGLNNLNYSPLVSRRTLYTNITVTLSRKLAPVANYWHRQNWTAINPGIKVLWD